ncbi:neural/ectodermal development factor IMP-L2-like [Danaus plexippus]|uniref:Insulin-related peptide binding protein n=1 Tax=Danaus plexippus plexippus TaxID=278856 RepID=A0A212FK32_DANPL|nr:neural/ectodermal development factor IMP-L2-like [Danaus plexippus]XP_032524636.1 neural/ectodermal development factor IMP-L2-like [Danaus plexippus]XP_061381139.1 neural/ectodermal development factor IMP-L2-like [Danaus plexippus]OWR54098.1 insulin-related peptide binding protein precursor [Danaus plexippus plexippus]
MFVIVVVLLLAGGNAASVHRQVKQMTENHIDSVRKPPTKSFITLSRRPPAVIPHEPGAALELTCEAVAAPAPSIHWFKNDAPVYEYDKGSNEIIEANPTSLARISSTLLVARTDAPAKYSCLAVSGQHTAHANTIVYSTDGSVDNSERAKLVPLAPKIVVSYKVYVDTIGSNIVLPCEVKGHPRPAVTWRDNNGTIVKKSARMQVLRSGALRLRNVAWSDLGAWRCGASNAFGGAGAETFLYPARPNDTDG